MAYDIYSKAGTDEAISSALADSLPTTPADIGAATAAQGAKADASDVDQITLTGNLALTIPEGHPAGQVYRCAITQDGTGGHTVTYNELPVTVALGAGASTTVELVPTGTGYVVRNTKADTLRALTDSHTFTYSRQQTATALRPLVSFYFDDAPATDLTILEPVSVAHGVPFNIAAIANYVDNYAVYMTAADLRALQAAGWEIDSHTHTHKNLATLTTLTEIDLELGASRDHLRGLGLEPTAICYPYGSYDGRVTRAAGKWYRAGLSSEQGTNRVPLRTYGLYRVHMPDYTIDQLKARVDSIGVGWLIFYSHSSGMPQAEVDKLNALIDYVQAQNIEIVTVRTALDAYENKLEVTNYPSDSTKGRFIVGADGKLYNPEIEAFSHVWRTNVGVTASTPITEFAARKVTAISFRVPDASGIALGQAGAGTLLTYRINSEDLLNYQMFMPWHATAQASQRPAIRYWTAGGWGAWVTLALSTDMPAFKSGGINAYPVTATFADLPAGMSMWDVSAPGTGYPATSGTVTTHKSTQGSEWTYQIYEARLSAARWKRWMTSNTEWSAWVSA